jgi:tripartite-type tricarboxylate transporter receptor subunit TctC
VAKLNAALTQVLAMPAVRDFYRTGGYEAGASTPEEFAGITRSSYELWGAMVQQVGLARQ